MTQTLSKYVCTTVQRCGEICRNCGYALCTAQDRYLQIHDIATGSRNQPRTAVHQWFEWERYHKLPIYFTGKKTLINRIMQIDIPAFEDFADGDQGPARITAQVVKHADELLVSVYANMGDMFEGANLGKLRVHTFLNNK